MIVAAHQPTYVPEITVFAKMCHADIFVLTDDFQYTTHDKINRNRIRTVHGTQWLTVPVLTAGKSGQRIKDVVIEPHQHWSRKHAKSIQVNYQYAPYYEQIGEFLDAIYRQKWRYLAELNLSIIRFFCSFLNIRCPLLLSSEMNLRCKGTDRIFEMIENLSCSVYLTDPRYAHYLKSQWQTNSGPEIAFGYPVNRKYYQQFGPFISNLSIVDLVLNEGPEAIDIVRRSINPIKGKMA
jgi:hypothetical protein